LRHVIQNAEGCPDHGAAIALRIVCNAETGREIIPARVIRPVAGVESGVAREKRSNRRIRVNRGMDARVEVGLTEMSDPSVENASGEIRLPAQTVVDRQV
jgi:hypothetical protein